ncbi:flagellar filament capping protein FliD [Vogesella sp. LIG4]|uniref:flagellar filament capping protein FliD n=1 Tax=Vogesella sp. LIG4 TaxID=1192162 RepID=UPI00081FFB58|nr:flagellar filament capping protein FliD [Vogesella sp. LIG4]SCK16332.1 flagellar hook-associated protein 2 [Vogesella sp. LIG4]
MASVSTGTLNSAGIGSNLPVNDMISKLMAVEAQPLQLLDVKEGNLTAQISAFGQVKGVLSNFQTSVQSLEDSSKFNSIQASSSATDYVTVSGDSTAGVGSYQLRVDQLAQSQKLATTAFASTTTPIGGGTLTFSFGTTTTAGTPPATSFTLNPDKVPQQVSIPAGSTMSGIRDAVNKANIGVTATIVNDGTGNRLLFTSASGTKSTLKIESSDSSLNAITNDPTGAGNQLTQVQAAQDAKFELDGMAITKQSNTVTDAVSGLTFNLLKVNLATDTPASINVSRSSTGVQKAIQAFVKSYNDLNKALNDVSKVDTSVAPTAGQQRQAPPLAGDATIRSIQTRLHEVFSAIQDVGGAYTRPADIGLTFQKDGTLSLDSSKLSAAISSNPDDVMKLFGSVGTPTDSKIKFGAASGSTQTGNYAINLNAVQNGTLLGASVLSGTINVTSAASFSVKINGQTSGALSLPTGSYTAATLASTLQSAINADSTLSANGATVSVSVDGSGKLLLTSSKTGTTSTVEVLGGLDNVTTAAGSLNLFSTGAGVAGADKVSGTIGGYAALGDGNKLTGAVGTPVEGLSVTVNGGTIGDRGTVDFTKGFAFALDGVLNSLLTSQTGVLDTKTKGLNDSVTSIEKRKDQLNTQLTATEARYRAQFNAMDTAVAQLQSLGTYLTQQLAGLAKSG